jgi:hypothetical protein
MGFGGKYCQNDEVCLHGQEQLCIGSETGSMAHANLRYHLLRMRRLFDYVLYFAAKVCGCKRLKER